MHDIFKSRLLFFAIGFWLTLNGEVFAAKPASCGVALLGGLKQFFVEREQEANHWRANAARYGNERWGMDGHNNAVYQNSYDRFFASVLDVGSFHALLKSRKAESLPVNVLDLFGSAVFLTDPRIAHSLTGVRLTKYRGYKKKGAVGSAEEIPATYQYPHWNEVTGNLYSNKAWKALAQDMVVRGIVSFDIIVARPIGGIVPEADPPIEIDLASHLLLLRRAYKLLNKHEGQMYVEVPRRLHDSDEFDRWLKQLGSLGFEFKISEKREEYGSYALMIKRTPVSPDSLP